MYESKHQPLATAKVFYRRLAWNFILTLIVLSVSLLIGTVGFYYTRDPQCVTPITALDAFHNACMLLSGMGPVISCYTNAGKWFSSFYALFSGVVFISNVGFILAPALHRLFHKLHLQEK